ncbi:HAD-IB family hydrolase [Spongiibacter marinus]|uniref:HAD-IB family hydrolase n=1 Tax=Spongiibacter marinus TaxID=354246 RepID=UPI001960AB53|nr:HAD-IB family hydrolase [Spongiibacter marinus]MBM7424813.1 putative phosphoserine phosphatase/1-acylglycerol-3-phosphate O-acyltransferase [Spongiibacter marinus]
MPSITTTKPLNDLKAAIDAAPKGKKIVAFFDFDGTIIEGYSAGLYLKRLFKERSLSPRDYVEIVSFLFLEDPTDDEFANLLRCCLKNWKGKTEDEVRQLWLELFIAELGARIYPEISEIIRAHKRRGHRIVVASSALKYQIEHCAEALEIDEILASRAELVDDQFSGDIDAPTLWGEGKAQAVSDYAKRHKLNLDNCFAYANGSEDVDFLSGVGHPCAVNPSSRLTAAARKNAWPQLRFRSPTKVSVNEKVRTIASDAGMGLSLLGTLVSTVAGTPKRKALNRLFNLGSDIGLAAAGIKLNIIGEQNLWAQRPAVFIFNHQSPLDLIIGVNLIGRDFTGVVKKEAKDMFGWGHFMQFSEMAFIDRGNTAQAKEMLAPAIEKLSRGISVGLCPEGTRSYTPKLGKFKKGAFHIAMQAGVPIVPVVLRNAAECMSRDSLWMRPGTVDVCVLPPIDCIDWTLDNMQSHIDEIENSYREIIADWPGTTQYAIA